MFENKMFSIMQKLSCLLFYAFFVSIDVLANIVTKILIISLIIYVILTFLKRMFSKVNVDPKGNAVLITGCDSGFGQQLALTLNSSEYRVYATVLDMSSEGSQQLLKRAANKDRMIVYKMDVTRDEDIEEVYNKVVEDLEENGYCLWSVVNNAGYGTLAQLEWMDLDQIKDQFEVNVFGTVRVTRKFLQLVKQAKGHIVNISRVAGFHSWSGCAPYSMTKFAVRCFSDALRREVYKSGVRVSTVFPGGYRNTNFVDKMFDSSDKMWEQLEDNLKVTYGGNEYFQKWKNNFKSFHDFGLAEDNWVAIEELVDTVTRVDPKDWYQPIDGMPLKVLGYLLHYVPDCLMDKIDYLSFEK